HDNSAPGIKPEGSAQALPLTRRRTIRLHRPVQTGVVVRSLHRLRPGIPPGELVTASLRTRLTHGTSSVPARPRPGVTTQTLTLPSACVPAGQARRRRRGPGRLRPGPGPDDEGRGERLFTRGRAGRGRTPGGGRGSGDRRAR